MEDVNLSLGGTSLAYAYTRGRVGGRILSEGQVASEIWGRGWRVFSVGYGGSNRPVFGFGIFSLAIRACSVIFMED